MGSDVKILASSSATLLVARASARLMGASLPSFNTGAPSVSRGPSQDLDA